MSVRHILLILALHAPLGVYVALLREMVPAQASLLSVSVPFLLLLVALIALPYVVLALLGVKWNPERSRLGEPEI